jgi:hypothetical protein
VKSARGFFFWAAAFVLIAGVTCGVTIYLLAEEPPASAYILIGDTAYPMDPTTSKAYVRQIERFGGKAALLFDEVNRWFASLWQGRTLGITVAVLSVLAALTLLAIAKAAVRDPEEPGA